MVRVARKLMDNDQALLAAEIVYALTNEKGRTRAERANERYYEGIRQTPYAPFVKLCDRLANVTYACSVDAGGDIRMKEVYKNEMGEFLMDIRNNNNPDQRFLVPDDVILALAEILIEERFREETLEEWRAEHAKSRVDLI